MSLGALSDTGAMHVTWVPPSSTSGPCAVCDAEALRLRAFLESTGLERQPVAECEVCGSVLLPELAPGSYASNPPTLLDTGAEMAIGLEGALDPFPKLDLRDVRSLLDVGCGYGWVLDFVRTMYGWRGTGLDGGAPARAGRVGLGLDILAYDLTADVVLEGAPFDLVYACEVIEHILDPKAFLAGVRAALAPGRPFLLRTPDAAAVSPDTDAGTLRMVLSPGYHVVLYTSRSLELVLRRAGFREVRVQAEGATLMAAAADSDLLWEPSARFDVEVLLDYLYRRRETLDEGSPFRTGVLYVLVKRLTFAGRYEEAEAVWTDLRLALLTTHGIDSARPEALTDEAVADRELPFVLCGALMTRGLIELNHHADRTAATRSFRAATVTGRAIEARLADRGAFEAEVANFRRFAERHAIVTAFDEDPALAWSLLERLRETSPSPDLDTAHVQLIATRLGVAPLVEGVAADARRGAELLESAERAELHDALLRLSRSEELAG